MAAILMNSPVFRRHFRRDRVFQARPHPLEDLDDLEVSRPRFKYINMHEQSKELVTL